MKAILTLNLLLICNATLLSQDFWERSGFSSVVRPIIIAGDGNMILGSFDGIFKSYDGGSTWNRKLQVGQFTFFLSFVMNTEGHILASCHSTIIFVSMDDGETWTTRRYIPQIDPDPLFYHPSGRLFAAPFNKGLYYSDDDSKAWTKLASLDDMAEYPEFFNVWDIAGDNDGIIYIGTNEQAFKSTDIGETWEQLIFSDECKEAYSIEVALNGDVYIGSKGWRCGLFKSTDAGASWEQVNDGFDVMRYIQVEDILCLANNDVFVATNFDGVYRSKNDGKSWHKLSGGFDDEVACWTVFADNAGMLYAGKADGLFRSREIVVSVDPDPTFNDSFTLFYDPVSEQIRFSFTIGKPANVKFHIFNSVGIDTKLSINKNYSSGYHEASFDITGMVSGVYFYSFETDGNYGFGKVLIMN